MTFKSDIEIAQAAEMRPIAEIAEKLGIQADSLIPYGNDKAKITADGETVTAYAPPAGKYSQSKQEQSLDELIDSVRQLVSLPDVYHRVEQALADLGSVRAVAKHYGRDRRQVYRWMDQFGLRE